MVKRKQKKKQFSAKKEIHGTGENLSPLLKRIMDIEILSFFVS